MFRLLQEYLNAYKWELYFPSKVKWKMTRPFFHLKKMTLSKLGLVHPISIWEGSDYQQLRKLQIAIPAKFDVCYMTFTSFWLIQVRNLGNLQVSFMFDSKNSLKKINLIIHKLYKNLKPIRFHLAIKMKTILVLVPTNKINIKAILHCIFFLVTSMRKLSS